MVISVTAGDLFDALQIFVSLGPLAVSIIDSNFILVNIDDAKGQGNKPGCARNPFGFILPVAAWLLLLHLGTSSLGPCSSRLEVDACSNRNCQRTSRLTRYFPGLQRRELLTAPLLWQTDHG